MTAHIFSSAQSSTLEYQTQLKAYVEESYHKIVVSEKDRELFAKFFQEFFAYIPVDYLISDNLLRFSEYVINSFEMLKSYNQDDAKVEVCAAESSVSTFILQLDRPFIVDSLKVLLSRQGVEVKYLLHPVILVERDQEGRLIDIASKNSKKESLIVADVHGIKSEKAIANLVGEISRLMDVVNLTSCSWKSIYDKTNDLIGMLGAAEIDSEIIEFFQWLQQRRFMFLSYLEYDFTKNTASDHIAEQNIVGYDIDSLCHKIAAQEDDAIVFGRIDRLSEIQRNSFIDFVAVKLPNTSNNDYAIFFGLPESTLGYQSIRRIPIIRHKLDVLLQGAHFTSDGYNARKVTMILEALPREVLFQSGLEELASICHHALSAMISCKLKIFIRNDFTGRFVNSLLFIRKEHLSPEVQEEILQYFTAQLDANVIGSVVRRVGESFVVFSVNYLLDSRHNSIEIVQSLNMKKIENDLEDITMLWQNNLLDRLHEQYSDLHQVKSLHRAMLLVFPKLYRQIYSPKDAIDDYVRLTEASKKNHKIFNLQPIEGQQGFSLKVYSPAEAVAISGLMPAIENLGFVVMDYRSFHLHHSLDTQESWLYEYQLEVSQGHNAEDILAQKQKIEDALVQIDQGRLMVNVLSSLVAIAGLDWRQVTLMKALTCYLHQTGFAYGRGYVQRVLIQHYEFVRDLIQLFEERFNPKLVQNPKHISKLHKRLSKYLTNVINSTEDRVLSHIYGIVSAILRTNYYQIIDSGEPKDYISLKLDSSKVPGLPRPVPFAEIFVFSSSFEAVHLRAGPVSRGGLRWSDRSEDYRVEVLGLMKAQNTKNTVIVPGGSKGAFCLKFAQDSLPRDEYMAKAIECYKDFLRGMLDVTDNIVEGKIIHPENVVCHDQDDPYLVVAADKGTATFSDYANEVAKEYDFWLRDAFASGGSAGYDHKKMGITSKGAWLSVQNHFQSIGIDVAKDPIRVVGIGDMSGDVFGNGMLSSKAIKLVAAFNHRNIFIDPDPDPLLSYKERERLFYKPGSTWQDYNAKLISQGGGIYPRSSKTIKLSKQACAMLELPNGELTPNQVIHAIIKSQVDLIWNGGIGTYVKASNETNLDIGDKANDELRCSANEMKAKVIGEGGNLGMSQLARIEFARLGGRVNTDFIDNSAGVDCSDHEVNIKIVLNNAVASKELSIAERNELLESMTADVEHLVLRDNFKQNQSLNISTTSAMATVEMYSRLLTVLENEGLLDREVEFLPSKDEMKKLKESGHRLTRPERAVIFSYSKMSVYNELLPTKLADDEYCQKYLFSYFPAVMHERFKEGILQHSLRREIVTTILTNRIVNQLGGPIIALIKRETGALLCDIVRSYIIICDIFELDDLWAEVEQLSGKISFDLQTQLFNDMSRIMRRGIVWMLKNLDHPINIIHTSELFKKQANDLATSISGLLVGSSLEKYKSKHGCYVQAGIKKGLAARFASLDSLISALDIIKIAQQSSANHCQVASCYFTTGEAFNIYWLRKCLEEIEDDSYWHRLSVQSIKDDLYDCQKRMTINIINTGYTNNISQWIADHHGQYITNYTSFITDLLTQEVVDLNMVIIANKKLEMFLKKL